MPVLIWTLAMVVLLGGCAATQTQTGRADYESLCAALNTDRSGPISKQKYVSGAKDKQEAEKLFQLCDTNKDNYLDFEEYQKQRWVIYNMIQMPPPPTLQPVPRR